jgi:hypothetical protein
MLGMCEMELAAKRMHNRFKADGEWTPTYLSHMLTEQEQTGFLELAYCGWLSKAHPMDHSDSPGDVEHHWCYNGGFYPTQELLARMGW